MTKSKHGGRRSNAGRPNLFGSEKLGKYSVTLAKRHVGIALKHGSCISAGVRAALEKLAEK